MSDTTTTTAARHQHYEALTDDEKYLAAILMDECGLDIAEFAWVDDTKEHRCYRAYHYQWRWWRCPDDQQLDQCIAAGQQVLTSTGYVPIEEVSVGDLVATHLGRFRPVLDIHDNDMHPVVTVDAGDGHTVTCTPSHAFHVLEDGRHVWRSTTEFGPDTQAHIRQEGEPRRWTTPTVHPAGMARVYNLTVEDDHSYIVNGVVVKNCGRSVGKSERIKARVSAFPFNHAGEEMVLIAPEGKHIDAITDRIEPMIRNSRLMTYMLQGGSWASIKHRPFKIQFVNCWFKTALPGRQGTGVKGIHPSVLEVDEGQDVSDKTWAELPEVLREDIESKKWLIHGVSNGRRDKFYDYSHDGDFTVHRFFGYHRPDWTPETKAGRLKKYGGTETSMDYRRNVLGEHGEQMNVIFVQSRLMAGVDDIPGSDYNSVEYMKREIDHELVIERAGHRNKREDIAHATDEQIAALLDLIQFPAVHLTNYPKGVFWAGLDYGLVDDPTEIIVAVEYLPSKDERRVDANRKIAVPDEGVTRMKVLTRIQLNRIPNPMVAALIVAVIDFYRPRAFSLDGTGIGLPLYQTLQAMANRTGLFVFAPPPDASEEARFEFYAKQAKAESTLSIVKSYNFSSKVFVGFDEKKLADLMAKSPQATIEDQVREAGIFRYVKDWATDILRDHLVNERRLNLPDDSEITTQMNGQSWGFQQEPMDQYGNRRMSYAAGEFHILDAMRMLALGWGQQAAERLLATKPKPRAPVLDYFG